MGPPSSDSSLCTSVISVRPPSWAPRSNLTHLVVVGYGCFAELPFEIQLESEVQVTLQERGEKRDFLSRRDLRMLALILTSLQTNSVWERRSTADVFVQEAAALCSSSLRAASAHKHVPP